MYRLSIIKLFWIAFSTMVMVVVIAVLTANNYAKQERMLAVNASSEAVQTLKVANIVKIALKELEQALTRLSDQNHYPQETKQTLDLLLQADKKVMQQLLIHRQFQGGLAPQLPGLVTPELQYMAIHEEIKPLLESPSQPYVIRSSLLKQLQEMQTSLNVLIGNLQDGMDKEHSSKNHLVFSTRQQFIAVSMLLMAIVFGLAIFTYQALCKILGEKPEKFVWQLKQLLDGKPLLNRPSFDDSVITQIAYQVSTDAATGLPNYNALKHWLQEKTKYPCEVALILLHVGELRSLIEFEDGEHDQEKLNHLVNYIAHLMPENTILTKYSDETFAIASTYFRNHNQLSKYLERQSYYLHHPDSLRKSFLLKCKIGAALVSPSVDRDEVQLMRCAELALINANEQKKTYAIFTAEMWLEKQQQLKLVKDLRNAIIQGQFFLVYQPQVDCNNGRIVAAEALIRWKHPQFGLVAPDRFIALAEQHHIIGDIGDWVLKTAILAAKEMNANRDEAIPISINISPEQLMEAQFVRRLLQHLAQLACNPEWIKLEITESASLHDSNYLLKTMIEIAEQGVLIAIDDFGTGYSSLSYLSKYPISQIKIDRSFIADIDIHLERRELVRAMAGIAQIFHYEVVVEGVETEDQLQFVRETGFNLVQGYYYYKPLPFEQLIETIVAQQLEPDKDHVLETPR